METAPTISVVIATRNRATLLAATLAALRRQRWPADRYEVVVADNGSGDATQEVIAVAQRTDGLPVRCVYVERPGKSGAVNHALRAARGELIAMTDDDVQPEEGWLPALAGAFDSTGADFIAGRILPIWSVPPPAWMSPALYGVLAIPDNGSHRRELSSTGAVVPIGANMALRRRALARVGGLCESLGKLEGSLRTGEDHEFFLRLLHAGCRGVYEPTAVVRHLVPEDRLHPAYFRKWLYQNGRDVACLERRYPPNARTFASVPRYRWREAAANAWRATRAVATRDRRSRVAASGRLAWFAGYLRERAALSPRVPPAAPPRILESWPQ